MLGKEKSRAGSEEQNHSLFDVGQTESLTRRTRLNEQVYKRRCDRAAGRRDTRREGAQMQQLTQLW